MPDIEKHLHQLSGLIRDQDSIKIVVRLESSIGAKIRYLAVVACCEQDAEEFCLLGVDCDQEISLGLVLSILSYTTIRLDGDGGFCVTTGDGLRSHIFKPVSVQTMWSALQSLYRASECAKENNSFQPTAVRHYEDVFFSHKSDPTCLTEWNILPGVENRRPLISDFTSEELSFQEKISCSLREILLSERDLDEVTSKEIRTKLENKLKVDLSHYKSFIDEEMLKILGQMESPALILDNLYLGSEWNASHQQDLFDKDINNILNVTTEIDNFFPDTFRYMNIPVCDTEETDILRYFNDSYKFINKARKDGKNVLVHCKMGISRSATIVIAYIMKTRNWDLCRSLKHVKERRNCVKPNPNFMKQLEVYEGILSAKRFTSTLEKRSKSESNLKQTDKSALLVHGDDHANLYSSSNGDITVGDMVDMKSHKKYFNTAPARLKPEKNGRKLSDILKPKSSSCAAILTDKPELSDIVSPEVISSFQAAVDVLENSPMSTSCPIDTQVPDYSYSQPQPMEIPVLTVTSENDSLRFISSSTEKLMNFAPSNEIFDVEDVTDSPVSNQPDSLPSDEGDNNALMQIQDSTADPSTTNCTEISKKKMSLKCCRRPYNGHTFSVSPNQAVNITSVVDISKRSVRHLVNEFELQSNRYYIQLQSNSGTSNSSSDSSTNFDNLSHKMLSKLVTRHTEADEEELHNHCVLDMEQQNVINEDHYNWDSMPSSIPPQIADTRSILPSSSPISTPKTSKKQEKTGSGCLPFFRKYSSLTTKNSQNKNAIGPGTGHGHVTKRTGSDKSRDKSKDKNNSSSAKGKILETVAKLSCEGGDSISPLEHNMHSKYHQSTGVVKQRLEAFEAKAVCPHQKQLFFRSHSRSHSATGSSGGLQFESLSHLSQRKSSMPHLGTRNNEFESSPPFSRLQLIQPNDRKASLDSNGLFKGFPCPMVGGFRNVSPKSYFSTSPNASTRVQHGSTHPLNLLPRTPTLT